MYVFLDQPVYLSESPVVTWATWNPLQCGLTFAVMAMVCHSSKDCSKTCSSLKVPGFSFCWGAAQILHDRVPKRQAPQHSGLRSHFLLPFLEGTGREGLSPTFSTSMFEFSRFSMTASGRSMSYSLPPKNPRVLGIFSINKYFL